VRTRRLPGTTAARWVVDRATGPELAVLIRLPRLSDEATPAGGRRTCTSTSTRLDRHAAGLPSPCDGSFYRLRAGDVVLLDEAGMAGTFQLDRLAGYARAAGAQVRLLSDPQQLSGSPWKPVRWRALLTATYSDSRVVWGVSAWAASTVAPWMRCSVEA